MPQGFRAARATSGSALCAPNRNPLCSGLA